MHSTVTPHDTNSDGETASEEGEAEPAHQQAPPAAARQPNGIAHQYTKGHAQSEAHLRHSDSSASEEEDDDDGQEEEEGGGAEAMQVQSAYRHQIMIMFSCFAWIRTWNLCIV